MTRPIPTLNLAALSLGALALLATVAHGVVPPEEDAAQKAHSPELISAPELEVGPSVEMYEPGSQKAFARNELSAFFSKHSNQWKVSYDTRNDLPSLIQGVGIPLIPGKGNSLTPADLEGLQKASAGDGLTLRDVATQLRGFMKSNASLLGTHDKELNLDLDRSLGYGQNNYYWSIEFQQHLNGIPVEGAHAFFRVNHGNIVQFGIDKAAHIDLDTHPAFSESEAIALAAKRDPLITERVDSATLKIYPASNDGSPGELYKGTAGLGYFHYLVWELRYIGADQHGYKILVNAHTGEILQVLDETKFAEVKGQIYPTTNTDPLVEVGMPFAAVSNGGNQVTDADGNYTYSGGTASCNLDGQYTRINDNCGSVNLSSSDGNLDFGGSGGDDCTTPGFGGAGNTHSARTGFYHLTNINRKAATFLPGNSWLNGKLTANMNINQACNAFWNNSTVNFYRSGSVQGTNCSNTGEIAAIFLHEWGHGMDTNAGGTAPENGTGEALGDTFAFLETRDGCIGDNFFADGTPCPNCRSSCSGVRDVEAFATGGISTIARPDTITSNSGLNCDRFTCPFVQNFLFPYQGPMGYQGHCESYIASTANWDLAQSLVAQYGTEQGWAKMDELWYGIVTPMGSAYRVESGGKCNPNATVNGCGSNNWYTLLLGVDDDDGDLSNGTPNGCRIWDAFDAHGIACGSRPDCSNTCTDLATADAGGDMTINEGDSTTIGTRAEPGHTYSWSPGGATTAEITVSPTTTTVYTVTATTSCDSATDSVTVTVIPAPDLCESDAECDDGLYCNGAETCDSEGLCQAGTVVSCDDGVSCTQDTCNESTDSCDYTPFDSLCDNGLFCDGAETCDAILGCQAATTTPCSGDEICNEEIDVCEGDDPECYVNDSFENGAPNWSNGPGSTCSTGSYIYGTPNRRTDAGIVTQVGGANTGNNAIYSRWNLTNGFTDIDGGNCILLGPNWNVPRDSQLSLAYFFGQRDSGDDPNGDFFRLQYSLDGGATYIDLVTHGDSAHNAVWTNATAHIPAGSTVKIRMQASDGPNALDLVEAGLDDVSICTY